LVSEIAHGRLLALQEKYVFNDGHEWQRDLLLPEYHELNDGRRELYAPPDRMRELRAHGKWRLPGPIELECLPYYHDTECLQPFTPWNARSLNDRARAICRIPWQDGGIERRWALQLGEKYARIDNGELQYLCHPTAQAEEGNYAYNIIDRSAVWVKIPFPLTCKCCTPHPLELLDVASFEAHCQTWRHREVMACARGAGRLDDRYADPRDREPPSMGPRSKRWEACTSLEKYSRLRTFVADVNGAIEAKLDPATWSEDEREAMGELASHFETHMRHADTLASVMEIRGITREAALELLEAHLPDCTPEACGRVTLQFASDDFEREGITHIVRAVLIDGLESVEPAASSGSSIAFMCCLSRFYEGYG
jgi:hypothetical protein